MRMINSSAVPAAAAILILTLTCGGCKSKDSTDTTSTQATSPAASGAQPAKAPAAAPAPAQPVAHVKINSVAIKKAEHIAILDQFSTSITNTGSIAAKIDGYCSWKCPVGVQTLNGRLDASHSEVFEPGATRTVSGDSAVICADVPLPIPLQCSYTVQGVDAGGKSIGNPVQATWNGDVKIQH